MSTPFLEEMRVCIDAHSRDARHAAARSAGSVDGGPVVRDGGSVVLNTIDKMLRGHQQSSPLLTRYEGTFSFKLSHTPLSSPEYYLDECLLLCKRGRVR